MSSLILLLVASAFAMSSEELYAKKPLQLSTTLPRMLTKTTDQDVIDVLNNNTAITFIGSRNGKSFYVDPVPRTQAIAQQSCLEMGLKLVEFDTHAELNYVNSFPNLPDYCWTGGVIVSSLSNYKWTHSSAPVALFTFHFEILDTLGLTLGKYYGALATMDTRYERCYHCYH